MITDPNDKLYRTLAILHGVILEISSKKNLSASSEKLLSLLMENLESASGSTHLFSDGKLFLLSNKGKGCVNDDLAITEAEEKRLLTIDMPIEVKDIFLYPTIFKCVEKGQFSFSMFMPMISGENLVGAVFIGKKANNKPYLKEEKLVLAMACKQIATVVHNAYLERELWKANNQRTDLYIKSITDPLTGLYHRAHMEFKLKEDIKVSKRYDRPFSALLIEIDYFFQISEMNGSQLTYHLLQGISKTIEGAIRIDVDLPARYSVDTIAVLLPETPPEGAMILAERIRQKINILHKSISIENFPEISASIGVACLEDKDEDVDDILSKLKDALENAKSTGRNKVCLYQKYAKEKEKVFSTFETTSGLDSDLLFASIERDHNFIDPTQTDTTTDAYKKVEYYQKSVSVDWNPQKQTAQIKIKNPSPDEFSYQPMMFLDFIDENEKEQLKKQQEEIKIPEEVAEKQSTVSNTVNVSALKPMPAPKKLPPLVKNKLDSLLFKKTQMKHGKIPNKPKEQDGQIHSLEFIDDI